MNFRWMCTSFSQLTANFLTVEVSAASPGILAEFAEEYRIGGEAALERFPVVHCIEYTQQIYYFCCAGRFPDGSLWRL